MEDVKFKNSLIMRKIIRKMRSGYSPTILIVGLPNSGKTQLAGLIGETLHPLFHKGGKWDPKKYLVFDMNIFSHKFLEARKRIFVIAEAGFDLAFDQWYDKTNRFFDRVITTQRVMGNCYILNIPVGKDLGRRHRRKIDYLLECKYHGYFKATINRIKRGIMSGDEFKPFWLEDYRHVPLPKCHKEIEALDTANKDRIRKLIVEDYQGDIKRKEEIITKKKDLPAKITCHKCNHSWIPRTPRPLRCSNCNTKLRYEDKKKSGLIPLKTKDPKNTLAELVMDD